MRVAAYARVSTDRQQQAQTIEQQVSLLWAYVGRHPDWVLREEHLFRDDGYSGARLQRPGLDALRDQVARAEFDMVVITAPNRLARHFVHQLVLLEEWERAGVQVMFIDRPPSHDPYEQLVAHIRGAVAEYEWTLIADRMRRGRLAKMRAGQLLPWTSQIPYGYRVSADRPRDPALVQVDPYEASIVQEIFAAYAEGRAHAAEPGRDAHTSGRPHTAASQFPGRVWGGRPRPRLSFRPPPARGHNAAILCPPVRAFAHPPQSRPGRPCGWRWGGRRRELMMATLDPHTLHQLAAFHFEDLLHKPPRRVWRRIRNPTLRAAGSPSGRSVSSGELR